MTSTGRVPPPSRSLFFETVNYSSCFADGPFFVVRKKPVRGMRVRPLMIKYKVSRFEYATIDVAIKGPIAFPANLAEFKNPNVPPPTPVAKTERIMGKTAAMTPVCSIRIRVKLTTPLPKYMIACKNAADSPIYRMARVSLVRGTKLLIRKFPRIAVMV